MRFQRIQPEAFAGCTALAEIQCDAQLNAIAPDAFADTKWAEAKDDLLVLGDTLVAYRGNEQELTLPEGLRVINDQAFAGNASLTTLHLPETLKEVRQDAFANCPSLQIVLFGDQLQTIGDRAFLNCGTLNYLRLGHALEQIGEAAFAGCPYLETVYLPDTMRTIGNCALGYRQVPDQGEYEKMNNAVTIYSNTECAVNYAVAADLKLAPLPAAENTEPAPELKEELQKTTSGGFRLDASWLTAAGIGGFLILLAGLRRILRNNRL